MKTLTVFTPTYNRAFCLGQLYESLCRQTCQDFKWLIVDDGSTDNTRELVESWRAEKRIDLVYFYKYNHGMHSGHNAAYERIHTELNVCIDSDDYMPDDAVEKILAKWQAEGGPSVAGIIGLDAHKDGSIVGSKIPEHLKHSTLNDLYQKYGVTGDKKLVLRTDVVHQYPQYPLYPGEKLVPLGTLYKMIDQDYHCLCSNDVYCIVEYLPEGSSANIFKQYKQSPNGFFYARLVELQYSESLKYSFTRCMHLVSSAIFAKRSLFKDNPKKFLTVLALPFGLALHAYILYKIRKQKKS